MTTLKEAIEKGKLAQFIKEHKRGPKGDADAFDATLEKMAGKSKPVPKTSSPDGDAG